MKSLFGCVGWFVGMFLGFVFMESVPFLSLICIIGGIPAGRYIGGLIEEEQDSQRRAQEEYARRRRQEEYKREEMERKRKKVLLLKNMYPEATKQFYQSLFGGSRGYLSDTDITFDKVDKLLAYSEYEYQRTEERLNAAYRAKKEQEREAERRRQEARREAERRAEELKRRQEELARQQKEAEIRNLPTSLPDCVQSWESHRFSSLKHKYFFDYYSYKDYKDYATPSMREAWQIVWNFKNDPDKNVSSSNHSYALAQVVGLVKNAIKQTFGSKAQYLTLVCLTASTQLKTERRFRDFADKICRDLNMTNAYPHIRVVEDGSAKHDGGDGVRTVQYDTSFFNGKYVVLFDDVRTSGRSLDAEKRRLESFGAKVICAITIAQTKQM